MYKNDNANKYLARFEDIYGTDLDGNPVYLDAESSISEYIASNNVNGQNSNNMFVGAFFYPDIEGRQEILTKGGYNDFYEIAAGKSVSLSVTFEYFIDGEDTTKITKGQIVVIFPEFMALLLLLFMLFSLCYCYRFTLLLLSFHSVIVIIHAVFWLCIATFLTSKYY